MYNCVNMAIQQNATLKGRALKSKTILPCAFSPAHTRPAACKPVAALAFALSKALNGVLCNALAGTSMRQYTPLAAHHLAICQSIHPARHTSRHTPMHASTGRPFKYISMRLKVLLCICCALALTLLLPDTALAWGPGVHMITGNWLLQNLTALPLDIGAALMNHPEQFLHGCLSPDIFIGKGSKNKEGHSHNWQSAFTVLDRAKKIQQQSALNGSTNLRPLAYAYGYMAHLAADTVAHNVYVPSTFGLAPGSGRLAHVYLEMQADILLPWDKSDALRVFRGKDSQKSLIMLRKALRQNAFSFWLKKNVFQGSIFVGGSRVWRNSMQLFDRLLPRAEREALAAELLATSTRAIFSLLRERELSPVLELDPVGAKALEHSGVVPGYSLVKGLTYKLWPIKLQQTESSRLQLYMPEIITAFPPVCTLENFIKHDGK